MSLTFMYITNSPQVAMIAEKNGVQRIWVDLETLGKQERQGNIDSVKSKHSIEDIRRIKPILTTSEMLVRVNPIHEGSKEEINEVIQAGADMIMLPMWKTVHEVETFLDYVGGRVKTTLLLETKEAAECVDEVLSLGGVDEMHIGLNDLHLSLGMTFMFELLADGTVERLCRKIAAYDIPYGFGGIARIGEGLLPAEKVITEHYRLGSTRAILSRSFCNTELVTDLTEINEIFNANMLKIQECENNLLGITEEELLANKAVVRESVQKIVAKIKGNAK